MEDFAILQKVKVPTNELRSNYIQEVLIKAKKNCKYLKPKEEFWDEISETLWVHLQSGLDKFDDQLLCSTCFYTVLTRTDKQEFYLQEILQVLNNELLRKEEMEASETDKKDNSKIAQAVSLMYGIFQSAFLTENSEKNIANLVNVLEAMFQLLRKMAYEYSKFTFIVFKTINSFKKVCATDLQEIIYNKNNQVILLNLVNHNWENPITGVRDLNKAIFQTLITVVDGSMFELLLEEISSLYWNKAKYLMLAEIIDKYKIGITNHLQKGAWIEGLLYSLHKPGLVSAGTDMYYAVFNKLKSEDEWCSIFLLPIIGILSGSSNKAIENFNNYWCLTTFRRFPLLSKVLIQELKKITDLEQKFYSSLCIIKQANKLGLISKNWELNDDEKYAERMVLFGLEQCNNQLRILAFDIVCVSQSKSMPKKMEYKLVLDFLHNNVNSDCTVLRLSMLNSFNYFLRQLHITFLNHMKMDTDVEYLLNFCKMIQEFIITSLNINGNYQRKITSIKLANIFLKGLNEVPRKRQKQTRYSTTELIDLLREKGLWAMSEEKYSLKLVSLLNDPAEDIRENVIELLLNHYTNELKRTVMMNHLIENALTCVRSKFFYKISCGRSIFKLIVNILIKENNQEAVFKTVEDVFNFAYNELTNEYKLKRGIVESIENGKQLHSFMSISHAVLSVCNQNSYSFKISNDSLLKLIDILEGVSNQFSWEEESSTSSDFSKISDMVQSVITKSGYNPSGENDHTKISGLEQLVLNCLWLNVKASCDLALLLIQCQKEDTQIVICEKCLGIITHVLEKCRHKGAIEAAGTALGQAIQHLTSMPENFNISKVPYYLLKSKLNELISEGTQMASVTRRGAGLSIMFHRIVSCDTKRGKPLFHYFMNTLLETCSNTEDIPNTSNNSQSIDDEKDLPKAIYIHFLTRIVTDSGLASDMMFYSAKLAKLAFDNLTSPHWQIRNAALQLYGALMPKLIGQKKPSGTDDETIATVACDELRTHSPTLWEYIRNQLKNDTFTDKVQYHSNLIPILNMLANCAKRYNFSYDMIVQKVSDTELLSSLVCLLDSAIYTVRRLTAKCIFNIFSFEIIYDTLANQQYVAENFIHGCLMLIMNCYKHYNSNHLYKNHFKDISTKFKNLLNVGTHSYVSKECFEYIFYDYDLTLENLAQTLLEMDSNIHAPGIVLWAKKRFQFFLQNTSWIMIPKVFEMIIGRNDFEHYGEIILVKVERDECIPKEVLLQVSTIMLSCKHKFNSSVIWKILYQISLRIQLSGETDISSIVLFMEGKDISFKLRYVIPFTARVCANSADVNGLLYVSKAIHSLTDSGMTDVDMRYIAAMANNELGRVFHQLTEEIKIIAIKSAIILLQDECEDVRSLSVHFYGNLQGAKMSPHPYICLLKLLDYKFLCTVLAQTGIEVLSEAINELLLNISDCQNNDDYNPFSNDSKNIYLEVEVLKQCIENLKNV